MSTVVGGGSSADTPVSATEVEKAYKSTKYSVDPGAIASTSTAEELREHYKRAAAPPTPWQAVEEAASGAAGAAAVVEQEEESIPGEETVELRTNRYKDTLEQAGPAQTQEINAFGGHTIEALKQKAYPLEKKGVEGIGNSREDWAANKISKVKEANENLNAATTTYAALFVIPPQQAGEVTSATTSSVSASKACSGVAAAMGQLSGRKNMTEAQCAALSGHGEAIGQVGQLLQAAEEGGKQQVAADVQQRLVSRLHSVNKASIDAGGRPVVSSEVMATLGAPHVSLNNLRWASARQMIATLDSIFTMAWAEYEQNQLAREFAGTQFQAGVAYGQLQYKEQMLQANQYIAMAVIAAVQAVASVACMGMAKSTEMMSTLSSIVSAVGNCASNAVQAWAAAETAPLKEEEAVKQALQQLYGQMVSWLNQAAQSDEGQITALVQLRQQISALRKQFSIGPH